MVVFSDIAGNQVGRQSGNRTAVTDIIHNSTADKDWLINKNSLLTQMTIYPSLIVRCWVISCIYYSCFLCIILWLHFWSRLIFDSDNRILALFKVGKTAFIFSPYPHINTSNLILNTRLSTLFKYFPRICCSQ